MRVGGLATGMDIEQMVHKLMDAERIPYTKMMQDRTKLTWKQDAFRDLNKSLLELDNLVLDMKLSKTYNPKTVSSPQENAITGVPSGNAKNGTYRIEVKKLATTTINVGSNVSHSIDPETIGEGKTLRFSTFDQQGNEQEHEVVVKEGDHVTDVLNRISNDLDIPVRAFYDHGSGQVIMETTHTGENNPSGNEIVFHEDSVAEFKNILGLDMDNEKGGKNATFEYNGVELTSKNNYYDINGTMFQFHNVTDGVVNLVITTDEDAIFDSVVQFVNTYNEVVEKFNGTQQEERFRDFPPLTDEQKKEMSEDEVKKWEEKAKSGILKGESIVSSGLFNMRNSWYGKVENEYGFSSITEIGITTSNRYSDGGKLEIDEDALRKAIAENPDGVQSLLSNGSDGDRRGIIHRLEDQMDLITNNINNRAGKGTSTLDNYAIGKRMKEMNKRISDFETRLMNVETRYWNQFTQMEKAIQRMNDQSAQLFSQFGGM
ncbi:MAG TPA: flagellar hook-associated protein 2 [Bacillota bacterium]|nr:flagellar hook-associated protein 2 [Bacillota bacterium]